MATEMSFGIIPLISSSRTTDAAIIHSPDNSQDIIAVACGRKIHFCRLNEDQLVSYHEYSFYGTVERLVTIRHPSSHSPSLLVVANDFRYSIMKVGNSINITQMGNLRASQGQIFQSPIKIAVAPHGIIVLTSQQVLSYFRFNPDTTLSAPFNLQVPSRLIIDFDFLPHDSSAPRVAVLTKEFTDENRLQIYEADIATQTFSPRQCGALMLPIDTYRITVVGENHVVAFSTSAAVRAQFNSTTAPSPQKSIIATFHPLGELKHIGGILYASLDQSGSLIAIEVPDSGRIVAARVSQAVHPAVLLKVDSTKLLAIAESGQSLLIQMSESLYPPSVTLKPLFRSSGKILRIFSTFEGESIAISEGGVLQVISKILPFRQAASLFVPFLLRVWHFSDDRYLISRGTSTALLRFDGEELEQVQVQGLITDHPTLCYIGLSSGFIQITPKCVSIISQKGKKRIDVKNSEYVCTDTFLDRFCYATGERDVSIRESDGSEVFSFTSPSQVNCISLSSEMVAVCSWSEQVTTFYKIGQNEPIMTVHDYGVDIKFHLDKLYILEPSDRVLAYDSNFSKSVIRCRGSNTRMTIFNGNLLVCGERPVIISGSETLAIDVDSIIDAAAGPISALVRKDQLLFVEERKDRIGVLEEYNSSNLLEAVPIGDKVFTVFQNGNNLEVSLYPFPNPIEISSKKHTISPNGKYVGITSLDGDRKLVLLAAGRSLFTFEIVTGEIFKRGEEKLIGEPVTIQIFLDHLLIAFESEIQLWECEFPSNEVILARKVESIQTRGGTSSVSVSENQILVSDYLDSLVLYQVCQTTLKATEMGRCTISLGISHSVLFKESIFCVDHSGHLLKMDLLDHRNYSSYEIVIAENFYVGCRVTSLLKLDESGRFLLGTENGETMLVVPFYPNEKLREFVDKVDSNTVEGKWYAVPAIYRRNIVKAITMPCFGGALALSVMQKSDQIQFLKHCGLLESDAEEHLSTIFSLM